METICPLVNRSTHCDVFHMFGTLVLVLPSAGELTRVSVQDLAAVSEQLEHLQLAAVGGHHDVAVVFAQKLHVQHLVAVTHKLWGGGQRNRVSQVAYGIVQETKNIPHVYPLYPPAAVWWNQAAGRAVCCVLLWLWPVWRRRAGEGGTLDRGDCRRRPPPQRLWRGSGRRHNMPCWHPTLSIHLQVRKGGRGELQKTQISCSRQFQESNLCCQRWWNASLCSSLRSERSPRSQAEAQHPPQPGEKDTGIKLWYFSQRTNIFQFSQSYLIDRYSSLGFLTLQVPHCTDFVSARTTNKAHNHTQL